MFVKFKYADKWELIPHSENWCIVSGNDFLNALNEFREKYESHDAVLVYLSSDNKNWEYYKRIEANPDFQCKICKNYHGEPMLLRINDEVFCTNCWELEHSKITVD